jgi:hypothetical protein
MGTWMTITIVTFIILIISSEMFSLENMIEDHMEKWIIQSIDKFTNIGHYKLRICNRLNQ